jgi:hypothetical protein
MPTRHCPRVGIFVPKPLSEIRNSNVCSVLWMWPGACTLKGMESNFSANEFWSDTVNSNLVESQIAGGVDLYQVPAETVLEVRTRNNVYTIVNKGSGLAMISGHPQYCPEPVLAHIKGSTWGGAMLKEHYIGRGMRMEFQLDDERCPILTSRILGIEEVAA